ncbi:MAG: undecaprenyldiphospho-muramoylpentapeptide beta-N-acetylglucosaminyltransferase [Magnetococcales bacterium]|nr:undecaprenyldiphospho-muramoylpentapeptide beta-N-acetylglucosaminyltransferase [Magnetococcales bacterium]
MNNAPQRLLIAGGGTGGHLFPALAVAEAWEARGGETLFVGTERGLEARILPKMGRNLKTLKVGQLKGGGIIRRLHTVMGLPRALLQAQRIVKQFDPHVVMGVGGYASAPAVAAARLSGRPTALHEQNALPGLANRKLGRWAHRIFISFPEAKSAFIPERTILTGNPVRAAFLERIQTPNTPYPDHFNTMRPLRLLVFGGSQGASIFSEIIPDAIDGLGEKASSVEVRQQARKPEVEALSLRYQQSGITARVSDFINDMATAYQWADLVICRAGATSVAEITAMAKPALLIPYPYATDDHQTANAQSLVDAGGGWMQQQSTLTTEWLTQLLATHLAHPDKLLEVGKQAKKMGRPQAARDIAQHLSDMIS